MKTKVNTELPDQEFLWEDKLKQLGIPKGFKYANRKITNLSKLKKLIDVHMKSDFPKNFVETYVGEYPGSKEEFFELRIGSRELRFNKHLEFTGSGTYCKENQWKIEPIKL